MKIFVLLAAVIAFGFSSLPVMAGTAVVGFEIGVSTETQVRESILSQNMTITEYPNATSFGGSTFGTTGTAYGIATLSEILISFDEKNVLGLVSMWVDASRYDSMVELLAGKYKLTEKHDLEDGSRCAHFDSGDSLVEVIAAYGNPEVSIHYVRKDIKEKTDARAKQAKEDALKKEAGNF